MMRRTVIVIGGPTASGKTAVAVQLAKQLGTEVISADSRQFYKDLPIGTGQPTGAERMGVKHHFIGHLPLDRSMSANEYAMEALPVLHDLLDRHGVAVVAGGSGLYIDALLFEFDALPPADKRLREKLTTGWQDIGIGFLQDELHRLDPITWRTIDRNNPHRMMRAIEVCLATGKPMSSLRKGKTPRPDMDVHFVALDLLRSELYSRIDARTDAMVAAGWEHEARRVYPQRALNSLQTVGYKEWFAHFDGTIERDEAIRVIKQHTRNYAKRQLTWLRKDPHWHFVARDKAMPALLDLARVPQ